MGGKRRLKLGRPGPEAQNKTPVVVLSERGRVRSFQIQRIASDKVQDAIREMVDPSSHMMSDEQNVYHSLDLGFAGHDAGNPLKDSREIDSIQISARSGIVPTTQFHKVFPRDRCNPTESYRWSLGPFSRPPKRSTPGCPPRAAAPFNEILHRGGTNQLIVSA